MPLGVSYMGTKRALAATVADVISSSRPGPLLDLFSGMCSIGTAVGTNRQVWNNDLQNFAWNVASAHFCEAENPPDQLTAAAQCRPLFSENVKALKDRFAKLLSEEAHALELSSIRKLLRVEADLLEQYESSKTVRERERLRTSKFRSPYRLFSLTFSGTYFGLKQSIEIDSLRFAFDELLLRQSITTAQHRWLVLALCRAIARCSTTTGHFAQFLSLKSHNKLKYIGQRRRSIWEEWLHAISTLNPVGSATWRKKNHAFNGDALELLKELTGAKSRPRVIYADPPYTNDQYSRYYHLFETLILYDYPVSFGKGRYRDGRGVSVFCYKSKICESLETMIAQCAELRADLVLSYPTNGLMEESRTRIPALLKRHYRSCDRPIEIQHSHSAMGGSKGAVKYDVTEVIYMAGFHV
jgi:adenine-specific DNA-methyltransferase